MGENDVPTVGVAVFGADHTVTTSTASSVAATDWPYADLQYARTDGRVVNTASSNEGAWQFSATSYDQTGNVIKSLDSRGIAGILSAGGAAALDQADLDSFATVTHYNPTNISSTAAADGPGGAGTVPSGTVIVPANTRVTDVWAPATDAGGDPVRTHTHTDYDAGAPNHGVSPATGLAYGLATTVTTTQVAGTDTTPASGETVIGKSVTGYNPIDSAPATGNTSGWTLGSPTTSTTVTNFTANTGIKTQTLFDSEGRTIKTIGAKSNGLDAGTQLTSYYTVAGSTGCPAHPEWAGQVCRTTTAETTPSVPVDATTKYSLWGDPETQTETQGSAVRTTTTSYDAAGRTTLVHTTVSGLAGSNPVDDTYIHYQDGTGLVDYTATQNPTTHAETGRTSTLYDTWGRVTSYKDGNGVITTTTYVASAASSAGATSNGAGSVATESTTADASSTAYTYDASGNTTKQVTTVGARTYTYGATYDGVGDMLTQTLPAGVTQTNTYSRDGQQTGLEYDAIDSDGTTIPGLAWTITSDVQDRTTEVDTNAGSGDNTVGRTLGYAYDNAGRLTDVVDQRDNFCQDRAYSFDANGNRTGQINTTTLTDSCADPAAATVTKTWAYNPADRVQTEAAVHTVADVTDDDGNESTQTTDAFGATGYVYDALGRVTTLPAGDTPANQLIESLGGVWTGSTAGDVTLSYYDTDAAHTTSQDGTTTSYTLDPGAGGPRRSPPRTARTTSPRPGTTATTPTTPPTRPRPSGPVTRSSAFTGPRSAATSGSPIPPGSAPWISRTRTGTPSPP
ncbi:hypothetical protein GCM10025864_25520 [Luteimicrobium album]|uniref:YD repeat-containing protein n=1 Tax=Luteimicrobium album TaxID=1054550 RepID=A0ABQ6I1Z5_9MICO|nr:hypothetical protein [Luteimicrobium album]GMA24793.1 hypothetical protein GCM10025864_25520 [Luteimicrobium album]